MTVRLESLFLFLPIDDVAESEDRLVRGELEGREDSNEFSLSDHVLAKRFGDHSSIRDRTRTNNLVEICMVRGRPSRDTRKRVTHDEASVELPPRPQHQFSRSGRWEFFGVLVQKEVDAPRMHLGRHDITELVWVGIVEELIAGMDDSDLLLLR